MPDVKSLKGSDLTDFQKVVRDLQKPIYATPGLGMTFDRAIENLPLVEDIAFGSAAVAGASPVSTVIANAAQLAAKFNPLEGEFEADGTHKGGTGPSTINSEVQNYRASFAASPNHVFDAGGLRLQSTVEAGEWNSYLRGSVDNAGAGLNANAPGGTTATTLAALGLQASDLANVTVGDVVTAGQNGLMVVTAKDSANGTITFEALSGGVKTASKVAYHVTFTKMAYAGVAGTAASSDTTLNFAAPLPARVVPGMVLRGVRRGTTSGTDPMSASGAKVLTVAADRLSITIDKPTLQTLLASNNDGFLFLPGTWAGQIWSKRNYGPTRPGVVAQAMRFEVTMPLMPHGPSSPAYTKAQIEASLAARPGLLNGFWPAIWLFPWKPGPDGIGQAFIPNARNPWSELDVFEVFCRGATGSSIWTGNLHDQPYSRRRAMANSALTSRNGGTWLSAGANTKELSADASALQFPSSLCTGTKRSFGVVWTRDKVIHYVDDQPIAESAWSVDNDYPHQLGLNVAMGSLTANNCSLLFFPQSQADATGQFMTIHSIKTWEL